MHLERRAKMRDRGRSGRDCGHWQVAFTFSTSRAPAARRRASRTRSPRRTPSISSPSISVTPSKAGGHPHKSPGQPRGRSATAEGMCRLGCGPVWSPVRAWSTLWFWWFWIRRCYMFVERQLQCPTIFPVEFKVGVLGLCRSGIVVCVRCCAMYF